MSVSKYLKGKHSGSYEWQLIKLVLLKERDFPYKRRDTEILLIFILGAF